MDFFDNKKQYTKMHLTKSNVHPDAILQFKKWLSDAKKANLADYNTMSLTTVDKHSKPHSRIVLLRGIEGKGFLFYTNYTSHKATNIVGNKNVHLLFFWPTLERQVRIEGLAKKISNADSDKYFAKRPKKSQISAWASPQSTIINDRKALEELWKEAEMKHGAKTIIKRPPYWGGYKIDAVKLEFWQGGNHRLHDRLCYTKQKNNVWKIERLAP